MKCIKCGFDNEENAKYCSNCGSELNNSACLVCSNCGTPLRRTDKFCSNCSSRIVAKGDEEYVEPKNTNNAKSAVVTKAVETKKQTSDKLTLFSIVSLFLSLLLATIGIFGSTCVAKLTGSNELASQGLTYYFKDVYEYLNEITYSYEGSTYEGIVKAFSIIDAVIYYLCFLAIVAAIAFYCYKIYKFSKTGEKVTFKMFNIISAFLISHLGIVMLLNFTDINVAGIKAGLSFGWGSILIIIGISLGLATQILLLGYKGVVNKEVDLKTIIGSINLLLLLIILIVAFGPILYMSEIGLNATVSSFNNVVSSLRSYASEEIKYLPDGLNTAFAGAILLVLAFVLYVSSFVIISVTKKKVYFLATFGLGFIVGLIGIILSFVGTKEIAVNYGEVNIGIGYGAIIFIVFSALLIAINILPIALKKRQ